MFVILHADTHSSATGSNTVLIENGVIRANSFTTVPYVPLAE